MSWGENFICWALCLVMIILGYIAGYRTAMDVVLTCERLER